MYTNIRRFKDDLSTTYPPDHFVCVPLVLDTLHKKVRQTSCEVLPTHEVARLQCIQGMPMNRFGKASIARLADL